MAVAEATATVAVGDRYHFVVRRLHSLSGIIPIGAFLCVHLSINATILAGGGAFQYAVDQIHNLDKLGILKAVEVCFIFLPIAFHAIVGVIIWLSGKSNVAQYQYGGNVRYLLQRLTGIVALLFILVHLWHVHWLIGPAAFDPHDAPATAISAMQAFWTGPVYMIGMLSAVFHLANGVWTFLITWGITIGPASQRNSGRVCIAIGIALAALGTASIVKLKTASVPPPTAENAAAHPELNTDSEK